MPNKFKLAKALEILNRRWFFVIADDVTSIMQSLIDSDEYVKDWTANEVVEFVTEVMELK